MVRFFVAPPLWHSWPFLVAHRHRMLAGSWNCFPLLLTLCQELW